MPKPTPRADAPQQNEALTAYHGAVRAADAMKAQKAHSRFRADALAFAVTLLLLAGFVFWLSR